MKQSAGILLFRKQGPDIEFFLVHPGGPFFTKKDAGWWTIPKGELFEGEAPLEAAIREFEEETGYRPEGGFIALDPVKQKSGKQVLCWAAEGDLDPAAIKSNTFSLEWPPHSGKAINFPEVDKAGWFDIHKARKLINERQALFLDDLTAKI